MNTVKAVLVLSLFCLPAVAGENPKIPFCEAQVGRQLSRWAGSRDWRRVASELHVVTYLSPTARLGEWLELRIEDSVGIRLSRVSDQRRETLHYRPGACEAVRERRETHYSAARMARSFTDATLRTIAERHRAGIIYTWSPHMPLSIERVSAIREAGRKLKVPVFYVLDPHADRQLAIRTARKYGLDASALRPMESIELFNRGMLLHYPSVLVFAGGKVRGTIIPGWKDEPAYVSWVSERLAE